MENLVEIAKQLVRPMIAVCLMGILVFYAVTGKITEQNVLSLTGMIIAFYFGERSALKIPGAENKSK